MATTKQKRAIAILAENGGNVSKAMREAGYTKISAATPKKLTESVAYKTLADRIPDDLLEKTHLAGLEANFKGMPDYGVRHKYLDSAYKLKGSYAAEKHVNVNLEVNKEEREKILGIATGVIEQMTSEEVHE